MRHKLTNRKLNRTSEHRKALIKNMLNALIKHEQIETTLPKAKELKIAIDKIITLGKKNSLSSKRILLSKLQDQNIVKKLTTTLIKRYEKRSGGYSRIVRSGYRYGDNAPKAYIELVDKDFNAKGQDSGPTQKKIENKEQEKVESKKDKK
ncbi:MAG: 50S ribosomal protein L17 [Pelagibacteraceae bacterium]|jgi:large subunit ribosomal protein L17|nr:MAG: 50S ribosomal protein L17 [alpha proteobacterium HIMB114]|tara:strand:- start:245 stop:694 length:450 start_codon:yes stop_codon:yes gene_type:complete